MRDMDMTPNGVSRFMADSVCDFEWANPKYGDSLVKAFFNFIEGNPEEASCITAFDKEVYEWETYYREQADECARVRERIRQASAM